MARRCLYHHCACLIWFVCYILAVNSGQTGSSSCGPGTEYTTDGCQECEENTYKSGWGREACTPCDKDDTGYSAVTSRMGATSRDQCHFLPELLSIDPTYGPESGETYVTMRFRLLEKWNIEYCFFSEARQRPSIQNDIVIVKSPPQTHKANNSDFPVTLPANVSINFQINNDQTERKKTYAVFSYLPDPVIYGLDRVRTIVSGGLLLTVHGGNLSSVAYPRLIITAVYKDYHKPFQSICRNITTYQMKCPVPDLSKILRIYNRPGGKNKNNTYNPSNVPMEKGAAPSDYHERTSNGAVSTTPPGQRPGVKVENSPGRVKRDTDSKTDSESERDSDSSEKERLEWIVNHELSFYIGFRLDGVRTYRNLSTTIPEFGKMEVFKDPEFTMFDGPNNVKEYHRSHESLTIEGKHLSYALERDDFSVSIGGSFCNITDLATNALICIPPPFLPASDPTQPDAPRQSVTVTKTSPHSPVDVYSLPALITNTEAVRVVGTNLEHFIGFLLYLKDDQLVESSDQGPQVNSVLILSSASACLVCVMVGWLGFHFWAKYKSLPHNRLKHYKSPPNKVPVPVERIYFSLLKLNKVAECTVDSTRVLLEECIGEGHFGKVFRGQFHDENANQCNTVAVKTLHDNKINDRSVSRFLDEVLTMRRFSHANVLTMYGVCFKEQRPHVILEYMDLGDLRSYVADKDKPVTVQDVYGFSIDVADGMRYLAKECVIHRDLAARNCMLNSSMKVKIADFGMSRDIRSSSQYKIKDFNRPLPARWMAVESLKSGRFTLKTDVWSFGILVWELFSRGGKPYSELHNGEIKDFLLSGRRLHKPNLSPPEMYAVMESCWHLDPAQRPTFEELYLILKRLLKLMVEGTDSGVADSLEKENEEYV